MDVMVIKENVTKYTYTCTYFSLNHCTLLSIKKKEYWFAIEDKSILMKDVRLHIQVENILNILSLLGEGHTCFKNRFL